MNKDNEALFDIFHREHVIDAIRQWPKYPSLNPPHICADVIERGLIGPLYIWLENEKELIRKKSTGKFSFNNFTHIEACNNFINAAEKIAALFKKNQPVNETHIDNLDLAWIKYQLQIGWGAILNDESFRRSQSKKGSKPRADKGRIAKIMADYKAAYKKNRHTTPNSYDTEHHAEYGLAAGTVRKIIARELKKEVGKVGT